MKKYIVIFLLSCIMLKGQVPIPVTNISGVRTSGLIQTKYGSAINSTEELSDSIIESIVSSTEIILSPNFSVFSLDSTGSFHALIEKTSLNPVAFKSPLGSAINWNALPQFERFEIGIQLPRAIDSLIESFLNGGTGINPYDQSQIKLEGEYKQAYGFNQVRHGFYFRDIQLSGNGFTQQKSSYPFRIRFAPPNTGNYELTLKLYVQGVMIEDFQCHFTVIPSGKNGFWSLNSHGKLNDSNGNEVFALGQNIPFALGCGNSQNTCNTFFDNQRSYINDLAQNQGNLVRIRLDPWSNEIEWEELGVYGSNRKPNENFRRQYHAYQLDQTFDLCENTGVYVFLTLMLDQTLQLNNVYDPNGISTWPKSPYSSIIANPQDFVTSNAADAAFKRKLDYIVARYGYSANLGMYSLLNETNGLESYNTSASVRRDVMNWHCAMSSYLKHTAPTHLITTGYTSSGTGNTTSLIKEDNTFSCGSIDIASCNHYSTARDLHQERHDDLPKRVSNNWNANLHTNIKPFIFGEMGMTDCNPNSDQFTDAEFHNAIWSTSMYDNAIGNGLYWYDWEQYHGITHRANFRALKAFTANLNFNSDSYESNWQFGGAALKQNRKIEYIEVHNLSKAKGYGWVKNADYYWINDTYKIAPLPAGTGNCNEANEQQYNYSDHDEHIILSNLQPLKYYDIDFWSTYGNGGPTGFSETNMLTDIFGRIDFKKYVSVAPGLGGDPDFAYKLHKSSSSFRMISSENNTDTVRLYRGKNCFQGSGYNEVAVDSSHYWDFGNGANSFETNPIVCYYNEGTYNVYHSYKDSSGNVYTDKQNIVVKFQNETGSLLNRKNNRLAIFPNPANNVLNVKSDMSISSITIYNSLGEIVINKMNINDFVIKIENLNSLKSGSYIIKTIFENKELDFNKFIKLD